jgi:hypothetical protein
MTSPYSSVPVQMVPAAEAPAAQVALKVGKQ